MEEEGGRWEGERHSFKQAKHASNSGHVRSTVTKNMCHKQGMTKPSSQAFSAPSFDLNTASDQKLEAGRSGNNARDSPNGQGSPSNPTSLTMGSLVAPSCSFSLVTSSLGPAMREVPVSAIVLHPPGQ